MIILYSTGCPKCEILKGRLEKNNIKFHISDDVDYLIENGFQTAPVLQIDDQFYEYADAMRKLRVYETGKEEFE